MSGSTEPLISRLNYVPQELRFGTSGRRGEVLHLTQLEIYLNVCAEIEYLQSIPLAEGGITPGDEFYLAYDLRPSSTRFVETERGRGEICQAAVQAARDRGMRPVNLGCIPTPALACYAFSRECASVMVTGSHIPFDRNGYKLNTSRGELLKKHEAPVAAFVQRVRAALYGQRFADSLFDERGMFKTGHADLPPQSDDARNLYFRRYTGFFRGSSLNGKRIVVYQHSAVGRDFLVELLTALGAMVIPAGRSETFVPIDTENLEASQFGAIQAHTSEVIRAGGPVWAVVSMDGDSDRPLVLGVDTPGTVRFFGGDLVGMIVAEFLGADAVVVPISCNDAIDRGRLAGVLEPKTKIGSPYVIEGLETARRKHKRAVCGWEANGGFLTGSDIERKGRILTGLATRDAILPILGVLFAAQEAGCSLVELFLRLPPRYSRAALLKRFPQSVSRQIIERFSPGLPDLQEVIFDRALEASPAVQSKLNTIRGELREFFRPEAGFGEIVRLNYLDGIRITFSNGDVAHIRPSGNADELRIYAVADTQERADDIAAMGVAEPGGILRGMEELVRRAVSISQPADALPRH
jgi:phosphomannomutase